MKTAGWVCAGAILLLGLGAWGSFREGMIERIGAICSGLEAREELGLHPFTSAYRVPPELVEPLNRRTEEIARRHESRAVEWKTLGWVLCGLGILPLGILIGGGGGNRARFFSLPGTC